MTSMATINARQMDLLKSFSYNVNGESFMRYFVEAGGDHRLAEQLWNKFSIKYNRDLIRLWIYLDLETRRIMVKVLNHYFERKELSSASGSF